ncbi:long-chain-alcohol O-fatty-acyltransferase [Spizellomyces sp. 'palustris']|nr:long-chain-alcohol O-fatty-acyltransferase [Spizellomyces sp. 'palustris']
MTTIAWVFALRTWEILNNAALESSIKGNLKHFCGYLHAFVDRRNPHLRDPVERGERFLRRTGRGILKLVGFHFASCSVPFLNGSEAAEFWAGTTYLSPSRYLVTVLAGLIMYLWMGGIADVLFSIIELLLRVRTRDMFERPYTSTSLRAFWRWRWNGPFQECLARAIIGGGQSERVRYNEKEKVDEERNDTKPTSMSATMLAAFNIFLLSGVFHEHVNFVAFKDISAQNCMFFLIQFVGLAMELQWSRTKMYKSLPDPLRWCAVLLFAALSGSLFVAPYMRNGGLKAFPFPDFGCVS